MSRVSIGTEREKRDTRDTRDTTSTPHLSLIGTSACPNGRFYCANAGFIPRLLPSSRVNDGVCDCCDGSDEYALIVACANTCDDDGRQAREALRLAQELQTKGYVIKLEYAEAGRKIHEVDLTQTWLCLDFEELTGPFFAAGSTGPYCAARAVGGRD